MIGVGCQNENWPEVAQNGVHFKIATMSYNVYIDKDTLSIWWNKMSCICYLDQNEFISKDYIELKPSCCLKSKMAAQKGQTSPPISGYVPSYCISVDFHQRFENNHRRFSRNLSIVDQILAEKLPPQSNIFRFGSWLQPPFNHVSGLRLLPSGESCW